MRQNPAKSTCCLGFYGHSGGWTTISLAIDLCSPCFNHISPKLDVLIRGIPYHSTSQNRGKKTHFFEGSAPHDILFGILFRPFIWHLYLTVHMIYFSIICSANRHNILVFLHNRHFNILKLEGSRMPPPLGINTEGSRMKKNHCRTPGPVSIVEPWKLL